MWGTVNNVWTASSAVHRAQLDSQCRWHSDSEILRLRATDASANATTPATTAGTPPRSHPITIPTTYKRPTQSQTVDEIARAPPEQSPPSGPTPAAAVVRVPRKSRPRPARAGFRLRYKSTGEISPRKALDHAAQSAHSIQTPSALSPGSETGRRLPSTKSPACADALRAAPAPPRSSDLQSAARTPDTPQIPAPSPSRIDCRT
jgi:hypothetical protein